MNALHIESERRLNTVAELLTSRLRPVRIMVGQNNGVPYEIVGVKISHWLARYQSLPYTLKEQSCNQFHYLVTGTDDFLQAVVVME